MKLTRPVDSIGGGGKKVPVKYIVRDDETKPDVAIRVDKYFALAFTLGCVLAALGGVSYAPITAVNPYMGFQVPLICFAVVVVGGLGSIRGAFAAAFALGMLMSVTGRFWGPAADTMVFVVLGLVLVIKPIEA